jgi:hypothetical protein
LSKLLKKVANFGMGTTERFDSEWEELGARGLKLEKLLVFVDFTVKGVVDCLKGLAVA